MLTSESSALWEWVLPQEHTRLVRLCARLTGDINAAEDLAQETLLEAWRHKHKLVETDGYTRWLYAIARNVCLRWHQRAGRERRYIKPNAQEQQATEHNLLNSHADTFDLELELERHELAELLDRALALLPADTRAALIAQYIETTPLAEVAAQQGLSESALKARLHRGKLALRSLLLHNFRDEAAAYGLLAREAVIGHETRIWCPHCGRARLHGIFNHEQGELSLGCSRCAPGKASGISWTRLPTVFHGVKGFRAALSRQFAWIHDYTRQALEVRSNVCIYCGGPTSLHMGPPSDGPTELQERYGIHLRCSSCHIPTWISLSGMALATPEGRRFWKRYPRIFSLPERAIEVDGIAAIVTQYQEYGGGAQLDVISTRDTCNVIAIYGTSTPE